MQGYMIKLKKLLKEIPGCQIKGSKELLVTGITSNSKFVAPGNLFIAKRGIKNDGCRFIPEAIQAGASAIVTDLYDPSLKQIVQVIHPHVTAIEGSLAAAFYDNPSQELLMVGLTGTNGKTTTSFIVRNLLENWTGPCGLIGTIEYIVGAQRYPATHTTPDVITNHKMLREMIDQGCRAAVMEVSSHALDQGRVDQIEYDVAIFSNLTLDHLDYHGSMENYGQAKRLLFQSLGKGKAKKKREKWAIVNQDSPWTARLLEGCTAQVLSYGIDNRAELQASAIHFDQGGTRATVTFQGKSIQCFWPLVGRFNIYNCLAAMGVALSQHISLDAAAHYMSQIPHIKGRLQPVQNSLGLNVYVDFAHSDDALINVLGTLREIQAAHGRLIVVFGCGGDRDKSKRPKMAEACERYADLCIVTSDNPRTEDPSAICNEIVQGFTQSGNYNIELDRRAAIRKAIEMAKPDDTLLIAGKGHEAYQIFAHQTIAFDDGKVAEEICAQIQHEREKCFVS